MFNIGFSELILILLVAFVIVGPKDLPKVARALGRGVRNVKRWIDEFKEETGLDEAIDEFNKTSRDLERTLKEADPRPELKKARDDVKTALDDASKAAEHTLKDQPQQEEYQFEVVAFFQVIVREYGGVVQRRIYGRCEQVERQRHRVFIIDALRV